MTWLIDGWTVVREGLDMLMLLLLLGRLRTRRWTCVVMEEQVSCGGTWSCVQTGTREIRTPSPAAAS